MLSSNLSPVSIQSVPASCQRSSRQRIAHVTYCRSKGMIIQRFTYSEIHSMVYTLVSMYLDRS